MIKLINKALDDAIALRRAVAADKDLLGLIEQAAMKLKNAAQGGGTVYACGNGGSACDAMHFTEELIARFKRERPGIRAMHFCDPGTLTCWANDYQFESVFARQVRTFCTPNDILVLLSTSGNSKNILSAAQAARQNSVFTIALSGKDGGKLKDVCDISIIVPAQETERIQEMHITIIHIFCEILENM